MLVQSAMPAHCSPFALYLSNWSKGGTLTPSGTPIVHHSLHWLRDIRVSMHARRTFSSLDFRRPSKKRPRRSVISPSRFAILLLRSLSDCTRTHGHTHAWAICHATVIRTLREQGELREPAVCGTNPRPCKVQIRTGGLPQRLHPQSCRKTRVPPPSWHRFDHSPASPRTRTNTH
jgi:hypothetical protein